MTAIFDMQEGVSITEARAILTRLPEKLAEGQGVVPLTRHGKPVLAIMTWDLFESLTETIDILSDSELMDQIRQGMKDIEDGHTLPWEQVKAELDL
jgi:prevent-host-death family protein